MPPEGEGEALTPAEVDILRRWIDAGAAVPADEEILTDPRQHWTYQVPRQATPPQVATAGWSANPIDAFIAARHESKGLTPAKPADRAILLRRVTFDLTGLPPTPQEISDFLADTSPDAWNKVVDRLLQSPHYGERWGRHWMDVWRYSDWDGYKAEVRNSQKHIWHWRDWIIESLNADKGYDRMIHEMLAADEIAPGDTDALRATGFLARNYNRFNRDQWLDSTVEHTSKAFLGVSLNCARCHDHKYDPIPQTDYYAFRAIFAPYAVRIDRLPGESNTEKAGLPRIYDDKLDAATYLYRRGNEKDPDKDHPLAPAVPGAIGGAFAIQPVELPLPGWYPSLQEFIEQEDIAAAESAVKAAAAALGKLADSPDANPRKRGARLKLEAEQAALAALQARWAAERARFLAGGCGAGEDAHAARLERDANLAAAELDLHLKQTAYDEALAKAEESKTAPKPEPKTAAAKKKAAASDPEKLRKDLADARVKLESAKLDLEKTDATYSPVGTVYGRTSSGRRLALAKWITAADNPLPARVAVNQIWMRHFGTPIVDHVVDFGLNAPRPELLPLLDWLAVELQTGGQSHRPWSMKHLHRLIVTSQVYQLSSNPDDAPAANLNIDRENRLYWRANVRRLEGESIRDCVLAAAGTLDRSFSGPDIPFTEGEKVFRRSIYFQTAYEKQMLMLTLFDAANPADCYRRTESVIPQQALAMSNSTLLSTQARAMAASLNKSPDSSSRDAFVREAFLRILGRHATSPELEACLRFLDEQETRFENAGTLTPIAGGPKPAVAAATDPVLRARENLILVLFNHNDCVTVR